VGSPEDIRLSFNEAAEIYDQVRPAYPADLFEKLFTLLPAQPEIVEVGPGTGQATKDLLARGASVHAIEIGPALAAKLRSNLPSDRLRISVADFEATAIAHVADAVFSATAYHWISRPAQTDRPAAILRPAGVVAIVDLISASSPRPNRSTSDTAKDTPALGHPPVAMSIRRSAPCWRPTDASSPSLSAATTGTRPTAAPTTGT